MNLLSTTRFNFIAKNKFKLQNTQKIGKLQFILQQEIKNVLAAK